MITYLMLVLLQYLSVPADSTHEPAEGNDLLLGDDVLQVFGGAVEGHLLNGLGGLPGVLQVKRLARWLKRLLTYS